MNERRGGSSTSCSSGPQVNAPPPPPFHSWCGPTRGEEDVGKGRGRGRRGRGTNASARGRFPRQGGVPLPPGRHGGRACGPRWAPVPPSLPPFLLPSSLRPSLPPPFPPAPTAPRPRAPEGGSRVQPRRRRRREAAGLRPRGHGARGSPASAGAEALAAPNALSSAGDVQPQPPTGQPRAAAAATARRRPSRRRGAGAGGEAHAPSSGRAEGILMTLVRPPRTCSRARTHTHARTGKCTGKRTRIYNRVCQRHNMPVRALVGRAVSGSEATATAGRM